MSKIDVRGLTESVLVQGEELLGAVRVNWNGMVAPNRLSSQTGLTSLGHETEAPPPEPDALVVFPSAKQMFIALTGGRLLCWALGFSGKPKQYLGEVPLSAVAEVKLGEIRFGPLLRIVMVSSAVIDLEVMRGDDGQAFFENFVALVGDGTDPVAPSAEPGPLPEAIESAPPPPPPPPPPPDAPGGTESF